MRVSVASVLAVCAAPASAFQDTSPFFLFSTSKSLASIPSAAVAHSATLFSQLIDNLNSCPSQTYVIVQQPGVSTRDFSHGAGAPHLRNALNGTDGRPVNAVVSILEVVGEVDVPGVIGLLKSKCGARIITADASTGTIPSSGAHPRIVTVPFPVLPVAGTQRANKLAEHDSFLHAVLTSIATENGYTVLYATTPSGGKAQPSYPPPYDMFPFPGEGTPHEELKRDLGARGKGSDISQEAGLFEKYQFLSAGMFMGIFAAILLFLILYVGLSALSSLQVSYFAFSREMGPAQQKKQ